MAEPLDGGWLGTAELVPLAGWVAKALPPSEGDRFLQALRPFLAQEPADDQAWLAQVRTSIAALGVASSVAEEASARLARCVREWRWGQLKDALARDWPNAPQPLTDQAAVARMGDLARMVWTVEGQTRQDLVADGPTVLMLAFRKFDRSRPFNPWAMLVLRHHGVTLLRKSGRSHSNSESALEAVVSGAERNWDRLCEAFQAMYDLFAQMVFFPNKADAIDYYAVFALECRLRLLERLANQHLPALGGAFQTPAVDLATLLPWHRWELPRRIKPDWPSLSQIWRWLETHASVPPTVPRDAAVRQACRGLVQQSTEELAQTTWYAWTNRARDLARDRVPPQAWATLFASLFPERTAQ